MNPRIEELINRRIDDDLSPEEAAELERHLAADPGSGTYAGELERLAAWLAEVPPAEAPSGLKEAIMNEVRLRAAPAAPAPARPPFLQRLFGRGSIPRPALAWAAAAGFAVGVLVFGLLQGGLESLDRSQVAATMAPAGRPDAGMDLAPADPEGSFLLHGTETGVLAVLEIEAAPSTAVVHYDAGRFALAGIEWEGGEAALTTEEPGILRLSQSGPHRYRIRWEGATGDPTDFRITVSTDGRETDRTLQLPRWSMPD
jgi:hypothetical protein